MKKRYYLYRLVVFVFVFFQAGFYFFASPKPAGTVSLLTASATMGNSRFSYKAQIAGTPGAGATSVNIETSAWPDNDTDHLFPKDTVCFPDSGENGCKGNTTYATQTITDTDTFTFTPGLSGALGDTDLVVASQSGSMVISFVTQTEIPSDGDILVTIPAIDANTKPCDGIPDHGASTSVSGFDLGPSGNRVAAADISVTGCTDGNWVTTETVTCGTSSTDHTIRIDRQTTSCAAGTTVTITVDNSPGIINPAPVTSGHTQGVSDIYTLDVTTRNGSDVELDTVDIDIAPIEAVLVSATVDETLTFQVSGVSTAGTACGVNPDVTSTATTVPYGTLAGLNTFYDAAHDLDVSTNADGGYAVTTTHTDQLGKDGVTCTGDAGASVNCIPDTTCDGTSCTHLAAAVDDWETATNNGFGYSLDSSAGTDATWEWDGTSGTCDGAGTDFCAAQFADEETGTQSPVTIMSNLGQVNSNNTYVCYRLSVNATQPAGYYQTKVRYTATATF